jgi:hypothetical protein
MWQSSRLKMDYSGGASERLYKISDVYNFEGGSFFFVFVSFARSFSTRLSLSAKSRIYALEAPTPLSNHSSQQ